MMSTSTGYERYAGVFTPTTTVDPSTSPQCGTIVSPGFETETLLQSIHAVPLDEIGSNKFMEAYCINLERLSIQAHLTAGVLSAREAIEVPVSSNPTVASDLLNSWGASDGEYVVNSFLEHPEKVEAMVKTLLAIEFWRSNVLFRRPEKENEGEDECKETYDFVGRKEEALAHRLAANGNVLRAAFVLHAETTIVSLLNLIFFNRIPAALLEGNGDEVLLALIDYCARQLAFLGAPLESNDALYKQKNPRRTSELAEYLEQRTRLSEMKDSLCDSTYQTAISAVALSRYLCEHVNEFGPSLVSRMLEVHDFPLLMVPLIEEPPWTRRRLSEKDGTSSTIWEKLNEHNEWDVVSPTELFRVTKLEGQPWLALYHLVTSKIFRETYGLDEFRKSNLMRIRRYLHQPLLDQLPVLEDVTRYLDELSILGVPPCGHGIHRPSSMASSSGLLMQRVDTLRISIVGKKQINDPSYWDVVIEAQWNDIFSSVTDSRDHMLRRIGSEIYGGSGLEDNGGKAVNTSGTSSQDDNKFSRPVEKVMLFIHNEKEPTIVFELVTVEDGGASITDTPLGPYRRTKLRPKLISGETEAIYPHANVDAKVRFSSSCQIEEDNELSLSTNSLALATTQRNSIPNDYEEVGISLPHHFPAKEWRQIGDLEDKRAILQLGFKRIEYGIIPAGCTYLRAYKLVNAFISQPMFS
ncbi:hypothetical protein HJC23_005435 [Cyclotella cryptica]|uniref:Uncharacterized protein n=1 Tax=Cyclotella cryptica TaxID=29204 RepID=A0ABD3P3M8_9STRA|eukprot:CCRYP_017913-RA/>CCRYP_017913-RA protein AED:0.04 eAED:0.04 QI:0/0/0/1/1/1/2/0/693